MKRFALTPHDLETIRSMVANRVVSTAIAAKFGVDRKAILRAVAKHDLGPWPVRPGKLRQAPADFAEQSRLMSDYALAQHYRCGSTAPARWRTDLGLPKEPLSCGPKKAPAPADFVSAQEGKTVRQLAASYDVSRFTVSRWLREAGFVREARVSCDRIPPKPLRLTNNAYQTAPVDRTQRDMSSAGQAADYLRRFGPVWRCTPTGSPDPKGNRWRRGNAILTDAELIERAAYNGFDRDGWRRVA